MTVRFNTNVHAYVRLPDGKMLPVQIDELRQALELLYARIFDINTDSSDALTQLASLAAAKLIVAPTGYTTAGSGSGQGRALASTSMITLTDNAVDTLTISDSIEGLTTATPVSTDYLVFADLTEVSEPKQRKATIASIVAAVGPATGDVVGPGSSTDNAIVRFDGTTGKLIQECSAAVPVPTISDAGTLTAVVLQTDRTIAVDSLGTGLNFQARRSGGGAGTSFGISNTWTLDNGSNSQITATRLRSQWISATAGAEFAGFFIDVVTNGTLTPAVEVLNTTLKVFNSATYPPLNITERSAAPTTPASNDLYVDDGTNTGNGLPGLRRYTGAAWEDLGGADHATTHNTGGTDALTALSAAILTSGTLPDARMPDLTGDVTTSEGAVATTLASKYKEVSLTFIIDGGGSTITTGIKGDLEIPFACTINRVTMLADQSGSIVVDIWRDAYSTFPPTDADSITASAVPTISSATKSQDSTLTGWTTSISAGDILRYNVDSATTVQRCTVALKVTKT